MGDSAGLWAGLLELQLPDTREQGQGQEWEPELPDRSRRGEQPCPVPALPRPAASGRLLAQVEGAMAGPGDGEASMSILQRLLANAALRDEAGRLRGPEPGTGLRSGVSEGGVGCLWHPR